MDRPVAATEQVDDHFDRELVLGYGIVIARVDPGRLAPGPVTVLTEARVFVQRVLVIATSHRRFVEVLAGAIQTFLLLLPLVGIAQRPAAVPALGDPARASAEPAST